MTLRRPRPGVLLVLAGTLAWCSVLVEPGTAPAAAQRPHGTGVLRGRVQVPRAASQPVPRPRVADLAPAVRPGLVDTRRAVVFLEAPDATDRSPLRDAPARPPGRARMDQRDETFIPHVLAVDVGTLVEFPNNDRTFHNVFSLSRTKRFDLGRYGRGKSETVRFDRPGVVRVFCDIHSHMSASILVFNHPYYATTTDDGRYAITGIPAGTYTVSLWHEGVVRGTRRVTITDEAIVNADLLVQ
jgi:hypothetical protein